MKQNIVFTGRLTLEKLKLLVKTHAILDDDGAYNPAKNPNAISIIRQPDGNYIGEAQKNGVVITARQGDPTTVLTLLITHS